MVTQNRDGQNKFIEMRFSPLFEFVPFVRSYLLNVLALYLQDHLQLEKVVLAASELLENAVKYSLNSEVKLTICHLNDEEPVELLVYNHADPVHAKRLFACLEEMETGDPLDYYIAKMRSSVHQRQGEANIGLARVAYESSAQLSARFLEADWLLVNARFTAPSDKGETHV